MVWTARSGLATDRKESHRVLIIIIIILLWKLDYLADLGG